MVKHLTYIFCLALIFFMALNSSAQNLSVAKFYAVETDVTANLQGTMVLDQNGEKCALIKVQTTQTGFIFDVGVLGVQDVRQQAGEVWVYVPHGIKRITVQHPTLGILRDYEVPCRIESARTYIMELVTGEVQTIVKQTSNSQYLVIKVTPAEAVVELDEEVLPTINGVAQKFVKLGTHNYKVQANSYHTSAGKVNVDSPTNKKIIEVNLLPAYGWIDILGNKENKDGQVFIDNTLAGTIPLKNLKLSSGEHSIRIVKSLYKSHSQTVIITDGKTTSITPQLIPDFSAVTILVDNGADIYVNEEKKGTGSWTGDLATGAYVVEAKKEGHRSTLFNVDIEAGQKSQTIKIPSPTPIYGSLNLTSTPSLANIKIDGKHAGETPLYLDQILAGEHQVVISLDGYTDETRIISVTENQTTSIDIEFKKNAIQEMTHVELRKRIIQLRTSSKDLSDFIDSQRKAANEGNAIAQNNLGNMYRYGEGVPKDHAEAVKWYKKAVKQGYAKAQNNLGDMYFWGDGIKKDLSEATKWYRKAAEQGDAAAIKSLKDLESQGYK